MNGTALILGSLYGGETRLAEGLLAVASSHRDEPEIRHVATDLADWSRDHAACLAAAADDRGLSTSAPLDSPATQAPPLIRGSSEEAPECDPGLLLLRDLLQLNAAASANAVYWELLTGLAKAVKDEGLLEMANACIQRSKRQGAWTKAMLKTASPQVLTVANR